MTNPGEQQPLITHVPGAEPFDESQLPNRDMVPIAPDAVTPQMMNHAIGSPYNRLGNGLLVKPAEVEQRVDLPPAVQHVAKKATEFATTDRPQQQAPLAAADIAHIAALRGGHRPTQEQIDGINKARARGVHLS